MFWDNTLVRVAACAAVGALVGPPLFIPLGCITFPLYTPFTMTVGALLGACCYDGVPQHMREQFSRRLDAAPGSGGGGGPSPHFKLPAPSTPTPLPRSPLTTELIIRPNGDRYWLRT